MKIHLALRRRAMEAMRADAGFKRTRIPMMTARTCAGNWRACTTLPPEQVLVTAGSTGMLSPALPDAAWRQD